MPPSASSAVAVLWAIVSWTCVDTRWSGRPNTIATASRAGASSSATRSSVGLSVNRIRTEPMSPMSDDSSDVVVWVSIVRISVTSDDSRRHELADPVPAVEVERQAHEAREQLAAELGDDPLPHHAQVVGLDEPAQRLGEEQDQHPDDQAVEPGRVAACDDLGHEPGDDERHEQPEPRADEQAHDRDRERGGVRAEVPEQPAPRDAAHGADPVGDELRVGGDQALRRVHRPIMPRAGARTARCPTMGPCTRGEPRHERHPRRTAAARVSRCRRPR